MSTGELIGPAEPRWREVLGRVGYQVYHLPEYVEFDAALCGGCPRAFLYEENEGSWLLPLVVRPVAGTDVIDAASPYGYPGPVSNRADEPFWERAADSLVGTLAELGVVSLFVRLDPLAEVPYRALERVGTLVTHGATVSIDLQLSHDAWWLQLRKNNRKGIRKAQELGFECVVDDWSYLDDFFRLYHETMARTGAAQSYRFERLYFEQLRSALGDRAHLMMLLAGGEAIDGNLMLSTGGVLQAHLGGTRTPFLSEASRLFFDEAFRWGQQKGFDTLHVGGGVGGEEDSLFQFKRGFSPRQHPFRTLRIVIDGSCYRRLVLSECDTEVTDGRGFFPTYRAPARRSPRPNDPSQPRSAT